MEALSDGVDVVHVVTPDADAMVLIPVAHAAPVPVLYQEPDTLHYMPELAIYYERLGGARVR